MADLNPLNWNWNQAKAGGKHVLTAAGAITATLVAVHLLTPAQQTDIVTNITGVYDGLVKVVTGIAGLLGVLAPVYGAWRAAHNASPVAQATSLEKTVPGTVIVTAPEIAQEVPSENVMSNTDAKVVAK